MRAASILCLVTAMLPWGALRAAGSLLVTVRGIEFPPGEAQKLTAATKVDDRYEAMAKAVDEGKATDLETFAVQVKSQQRVQTASGEEVLFPTDPLVSCTVMGLLPEPPKRPSIPGDILVHEFAAFETRNTGVSYDFWPTGDGGHGCDLGGTFTFTVQEPERIILKHQVFEGMPQVIVRPVFHETKLNIGVSMADGQWIMAGLVDSWRKDAPPGSKVAMWVTVESLDESEK